jgi:serine/threonine-protein kinase
VLQAGPDPELGADVGSSEGEPSSRLDVTPVSPSDTIAHESNVSLHEAATFADTLMGRAAGLEMLEPVEQVPNVALVGEINRGGMGAILKGRDLILGRDLAIKVLLEENRGNFDLVRRLRLEAQVTGQLQHPGIIPVYEMGTLSDSRPFFTMKLVKGRTLADLLEQRKASEPPDADRVGAAPAADTATEAVDRGESGRNRPEAADLPRYLSIFEAVCQTVAYAHSRGVIHRDLKPSNVMVGAFGEVLVMDWGLAKVLDSKGSEGERPQPESPPQRTVITTTRDSLDAALSVHGAVMGTPLYMAPEQARGESEEVDERADVFALGSILCEILTGKPGIVGRNVGEIGRKAARGDVSDAYLRLDRCGADTELTALAKESMAPEREDRPRHAGILAERMTAYLAGVQDRLRTAEVARATEQARAEEEAKRRVLADELAQAAQARAEEAGRAAQAANARARAESQARRLQLGLAATVLAAMALIGLGAARWVELRHDRERRFDTRLAEAVLALQLAKRADQTTAAVRWREARAALDNLKGVASDGLDAERERKLKALEASFRVDEKVLILLAKLEATRGNLAETSDAVQADREYRDSFREFLDADLDSMDPQRAGEAIQQSMAAEEIAGALDDWALLHRKPGQSGGSQRWQRLELVARSADPDPWRDALRQQFGTWDKTRLDELARSSERDGQPPASLLLLARALAEQGMPDRAATVLRSAWHLSPNDFWINYDLGNLAFLLKSQGKCRPDEPIRFLTAAVGIRPKSAIAHNRLGMVLGHEGRLSEASAEFDRAVKLKGDLPGLRFNLGVNLHAQRQLDQAVTQYHKALELMPNFAEPHAGLGDVLADQGKLAPAILEYRKAIELKPSYDDARIGLGEVLMRYGRPGEAETEYRKVLEHRPAEPAALLGLTLALSAGSKTGESTATYDKLIGLTRDRATSKTMSKKILNNIAYAALGKGDLATAERILDEVRRQDPDHYAAAATSGELLVIQGRFPAALERLKRASELYAEQGVGLPPHYPGLIKRVVEPLARQDEALRRLASQVASSGSGGTCLELAPRALAAGLPATAAMLYTAMFLVHNDFASDPLANRLFDAARAAVAAATGPARSGDLPLDDKSRTAWQQRARKWLHADLLAKAMRLEQGLGDRAALRRSLERWRTDADLAGVRGSEALAAFPPEEREAWVELWKQLDSLLGKQR